MPLIEASTYRPNRIFRFGHINTVYPALFRKVDGVTFQRERVDTPDGDFLDLDWSTIDSKRLLIALHGLEGMADRAYIKGMIRLFNQAGWDGLGLNFRGCSGELNKCLHSYHMGQTQDLGLVLQHCLEKKGYEEIALVGFSLGGNVLLKYLGEQGRGISSNIVGAIAFSVPCHIKSANVMIARKQNYFYLRRFLKSLNQKMIEKEQIYGDQVNPVYPLAKNFTEFDNRFTAPIHGFKDALDYWEQSSSLQFFPDIHVPTLLVNAQDDSFLSAECFPFQMAKQHKFLHLESPKYGGHVGFSSFGEDGVFWSEKRALAFIQAQC
jgi:hypothetical protein